MSKGKKIALWSSLTVFFLVAIGAGMLLRTYGKMIHAGGGMKGISNTIVGGVEILHPKEGFPGQDKLTIVCMGIDDNWTNSDVVYTANARTDTLFVLTLDLKNKKATMLSIPRDTYAHIVGTKRDWHFKINAAYTTGGPIRTIATVNEFLGTSANHYMVLNIDATKKMVDAIGGVDVNVEHEMHYHDKWGHLSIDLHPGQQHLVGALEGVHDADLLVADRQQPVVRDHDERVDLLTQRLDALLGCGRATPALEGERPGDHADRERADRAGHAGHDGRATRPGATALAGGHEHHVGALEHLFDLVAVVLGGLPADLGGGAGAEPAGELAADVELDVRVTHQQRLRVGVDRDELDALETNLDHAVDGVDATSTDADHLDHGQVVLRCCHGMEPLGSRCRRTETAQMGGLHTSRGGARELSISARHLDFCLPVTSDARYVDGS